MGTQGSRPKVSRPAPLEPDGGSPGCGSTLVSSQRGQKGSREQGAEGAISDPFEREEKVPPSKEQAARGSWGPRSRRPTGHSTAHVCSAEQRDVRSSVYPGDSLAISVWTATRRSRHESTENSEVAFICVYFLSKLKGI